jgi:hypothetical protein
MAMNPPEMIVKDLLVAAGVGTFAATTGWSISVGRLPTAPESALCCVPTGGLSPWPGKLLNFPSVQVIVRGNRNDYLGAQNKTREVIDVLLGRAHETIAGGDFLGGITQIGDAAFIGFDASDCPMFSCNFSMIIEPKAGGHRQPL